MKLKRELLHDGVSLACGLEPRGGDHFAVTVGERQHDVRAARLPDGRIRFELAGRHHVAEVVETSGKIIQVRIDGHTWELRASRGKARVAPDSASKTIEAPMSGTISKVLVRVGDAVEKGQTLIVLTAMKMEHKLAAGTHGTVQELNALEGASVEQGILLLRIG